MRLLVFALAVGGLVALVLHQLPRLRARLGQRRRAVRALPEVPDAVVRAAEREPLLSDALAIRVRVAALLTRQGAAGDPWFLEEMDGILEALRLSLAVARELELQRAADAELRPANTIGPDGTRASASPQAARLEARRDAIWREAEVTVEALRGVWADLLDAFEASAATESLVGARDRLAALRRRADAEREARALAPEPEQVG